MMIFSALIPLLAVPTPQEPLALWRHLSDPERDYALVLPEGYERGATYPVLVALPPGTGDRALVERGLELYWAREARARGWALVSPVLAGVDPGEALRGIDAVLSGEVVPEGGRFFLAGVSNGGRAAFHAALDEPRRWHGLLGAPAMPDPADRERLALLAGWPVDLVVGQEDATWLAGARGARDELARIGARVRLETWPGSGHVLPAEVAPMLYGMLEEERARARLTAEAEAALTDFHRAAAEADGPRYFAHFAPGAVFLGTDASERWSADEFAAYAQPYFSRGEGWTYVATERHVTLSRGKETAWFDERLQNAKYGEVRGSGVLVRVEGRWLLAQYNLALPVPNELAADLVERIRGLEGR